MSEALEHTDYEDPYELHEIIRRPISEGEVVLRAAGKRHWDRVKIEAQIGDEVIEVPLPEDATWPEIWKAYHSFEHDEHTPRAA